MDVRGLSVVLFFLLLVAISCWLVLSPVFSTANYLRSNGVYQAAIIVLIVCPVVLLALLALGLCLSRRT